MVSEISAYLGVLFLVPHVEFRLVWDAVPGLKAKRMRLYMSNRMYIKEVHVRVVGGAFTKGS